jgi:hypothetical protein
MSDPDGWCSRRRSPARTTIPVGSVPTNSDATVSPRASAIRRSVATEGLAVPRST